MNPFGGMDLGGFLGGWRPLGGYELIGDPSMGERRQVHFGKSKKKRLRKKQAKKPSSWQFVPSSDAYMIGHRIIAHPQVIAAIKAHFRNA